MANTPNVNNAKEQTDVNNANGRIDIDKQLNDNNTKEQKNSTDVNKHVNNANGQTDVNNTDGNKSLCVESIKVCTYIFPAKCNINLSFELLYTNCYYTFANYKSFSYSHK